ncbi:dual specificity protein kinase TTK [Musca vetustissima]|uniref:dual specificity protein kinase TTK n=1 Tax=Musca vetustissima TaxID=27455 RepID=UPI002AB7F1D9|nr:dual specificity protein kinase TTK [Musca vetustissima]
MSFHYPRRVKDLPKLELDSEDEFNTPLKTRQPPPPKDKFSNSQQSTARSNKENENNANSCSTFSFNNLRMVPKRRAELPALESDSEDESAKDDNLNCAILNDSFVLTPGKSYGEAGSKESSVAKGKCNETSDMSLLAHFNNMDLKSPPKEQKTDKPAQESSNNSAATTESHEAHNAPASTVKNASSIDAQFATPQIRSFSVQRRPRDLCSTQSQKTKSAIVNEFRSQKVLFQTPMAITRAPMSCLPNDSISFSLCDTINEGGTPSTTEKTPKCPAEKPTGRSKKSLEGEFMEVTREQQAQKIENNKCSAITTRDKETIVHINNSDYIIMQKLGCGGSSSVYLAKRADNDKECALKVVDLQGDPAVVEGYLNETKLLAKLQGNVCVVSLYEYQLLRKESKLFLVMEKGDSDLHKILQSYTTNLPLYVLTNFVYQMLQAVNYIHQNGVIHSDLKPANFLMVNGRLKLIDFGIASNIAIDSTSIIKFSQAGTFNYISPEALTDTSTGSSPMRSNQPKIKISTKSDVWSLGCILYLLLYKKTPFGHIKNLCAKISAICSPTQNIEFGPLPPYYPAMLVHMAKNCLQHNPKQRPSCADLLKYPFNMIIPIQNLSLPPK